MNTQQNEIIEMAKTVRSSGYWDAFDLIAFAELVTAKEREEFAVHAVDIARRAVAEEREACAKVCDDTFYSVEAAQKIRARGEAYTSSVAHMFGDKR